MTKILSLNGPRSGKVAAKKLPGNPVNWRLLRQQLLRKNPVLVNFMGLCPVLAVTNTLYNAMGMALSTAAVLLGTSIIASALRNFIPAAVRIPAYIIIIASLVSVVDLLLQAYTPELSRNLGAFVSLIVVNCLILGQVESFSSRHPLLPSLWQAICTSVGFIFAILLVAAVREILGSGSLTFGGKNLWPEARNWSLGTLQLRLHRGQILGPFSPKLGGESLFIFTLPAGALFVVAYLAAFFVWWRRRSESRMLSPDGDREILRGDNV